MKSYILALKHLEKSHTAKNLLSELKEVMVQAEIGQKVVTVSADGAYNIKKVSQLHLICYNNLKLTKLNLNLGHSRLY
jgi:hypothetical protein